MGLTGLNNFRRLVGWGGEAHRGCPRLSGTWPWGVIMIRTGGQWSGAESPIKEVHAPGKLFALSRKWLTWEGQPLLGEQGPDVNTSAYRK